MRSDYKSARAGNAFNKFNISTNQHFNISTNRVLRCARKDDKEDAMSNKIYVYIFYIIYI